MIDVSVIIVSCNTRELTLEAVRSVLTRTSGLTFEIIVVDNGSTDGSASAIATHFPESSLIRLSDNVGFAAANNLAARGARENSCSCSIPIQSSSAMRYTRSSSLLGHDPTQSSVDEHTLQTAN